MKIPILKPTDRSREYNNYSQEERDKVIYNYLFSGLSHRDMDKKILKLDFDYSRGWQSMGILHHLGLKNEFKGLFTGMSEEEAIRTLSELNDSTYSEVINCITRMKNSIVYGTYDSWEIISDTVAIKTTDKSVFEHHGSGVPIEIRNFWRIDNLEQGQKLYIKFVYQDKEYEAYFEKENNVHARTRLFWYATFQEAIRNTFPDYKRYESDPDLFPLMRFEKIDIERYNISFIQPEYINVDTAAEQEDEKKVVINIEGKKEGQASYGYSKKYERNPKNRLAAIKIHGCKCVCCGFDFEKVYGARGAGFIEIHHNKPLYSLDEEVVINPETDLSPVCSNCHRIIHRKKNDVLSVERVREIVNLHIKERIYMV